MAIPGILNMLPTLQLANYTFQGNVALQGPNDSLYIDKHERDKEMWLHAFVYRYPVSGINV